MTFTIKAKKRALRNSYLVAMELPEEDGQYRVGSTLFGDSIPPLYLAAHHFLPSQLLKAGKNRRLLPSAMPGPVRGGRRRRAARKRNESNDDDLSSTNSAASDGPVRAVGKEEAMNMLRGEQRLPFAVKDWNAFDTAVLRPTTRREQFSALVKSGKSGRDAWRLIPGGYIPGTQTASKKTRARRISTFLAKVNDWATQLFGGDVEVAFGDHGLGVRVTKTFKGATVPRLTGVAVAIDKKTAERLTNKNYPSLLEVDDGEVRVLIGPISLANHAPDAPFAISPCVGGEVQVQRATRQVADPVVEDGEKLLIQYADGFVFATDDGE